MARTRPEGRPGNFGELVDTHQSEILRYLRRLTGDSATAEDLFQDTFLRAFGGYARLRPGSNHRAWLYRIATNLFLNHRSAGGRRTRVALTPELASSDPSPSRAQDTAAACPGASERRSCSGSCTVSATARSPRRSGAPRRRRAPTSTRQCDGSVASLRPSGGHDDV